MGLFSGPKYSLIKEDYSEEFWDRFSLDFEDNFIIEYSIMKVYNNDVFGEDNRSGPNKKKVSEGNNLEELIKIAEDYNKEQEKIVLNEVHKQLDSGEMGDCIWPFPVNPRGV